MSNIVTPQSGAVPIVAMAYGAEWSEAQEVTRDYPLPVVDPLLNEAIRDIAFEYGKVVWPKGKTLRKFGATVNADAGEEFTVAEFPGATQYNEDYSTTNDIDALVCENDGDTGPIYGEGHFFDGNGDLKFQSETVTATGNTVAPLSRGYCRWNRLKRPPSGTFASPVTPLAGNVFVFASSGVTVTAGVPQTATAVKCMITEGRQQSYKCASSISVDDFFVATSVSVYCRRDTASGVVLESDIRYRQKGGAFLPLGLDMLVRRDGNLFDRIMLNPYEIIPQNSDFALRGILSGGSNIKVGGRIAGYLCSVIGDVG